MIDESTVADLTVVGVYEDDYILKVHHMDAVKMVKKLRRKVAAYSFLAPHYENCIAIPVDEVESLYREVSILFLDHIPRPMEIQHKQIGQALKRLVSHNVE